MPVRRVFYTGRTVFPFQYFEQKSDGVQLPGWHPLFDEDVTLAEWLGERGYTTGLISDVYHQMKPGKNFHRGFHSWQWIRGQESDCLVPTPACDIDVSHYVNPNIPQDDHKRIMVAQYLNNRAWWKGEQDHYAAQVMRSAADWIRNHGHKKPWMLWVESFDPHEPWDAPQWYEDMYDPGYKGISYRYPIYGPASTYTKSELNHMRACYAGEATLVDRWVGHLLESIERMGLLENTCVVFTADHGICVGDHGWTGKNAPPLYEEVAHTPLIVHMPGQTKSRHVKELTQPVDLMPTFLDLAKVRTPKGLQQDGVSLKPALEGKSRKLRDYAFSRGGKGLVITDREWSLVYASTVKGGAGADCAPELFNLVKDPTQTKNVLKRNIAQARRMWDAYDAWLQEGGVVDGSAEKSPRP